MNCQQFTSFIVEVARGQMMDAALRDGATRHAESCQACAARLAQEQSLTDALRAVALDMKDLGAPARLEAQLLAAFRESLAPQNATATATGASTPPHALVSLQASSDGRKGATSRRTRRVAYTTTAIAASLVLVLLAARYLRFMQTAPPSSPPDLAKNSKQSVSQESPTDRKLAVGTPSPLAASIKSSIDGSGREPKGEAADTQRSGASERTAVRLARQQQQRVPTMIKAQHVIDGGNAIIEESTGGETAAANTSARPNEAESVTEFISLVADAPAAPPLESGQLVRVQVPRAALASLGVPLNAERGNEPVKADVLLGGDGLARAIRFVR
jgi:hypothetical protein